MSLIASCPSSSGALSREPVSVPYATHRGAASAPHHQSQAPSSRPSAHEGGAEGRKRRSPSTFRGKASKLSRPDGLQSDSGGILASGPEPPRQVTVTCIHEYDLTCSFLNDKTVRHFAPDQSSSTTCGLVQLHIAAADSLPFKIF